MSRERILDGLGAVNVSEARAREALAFARSIVVLTGAGISAESGIPTFRDAMVGPWALEFPHDAG